MTSINFIRAVVEGATRSLREGDSEHALNLLDGIGDLITMRESINDSVNRLKDLSSIAISRTNEDLEERLKKLEKEYSSLNDSVVHERTLRKEISRIHSMSPAVRCLCAIEKAHKCNSIPAIKAVREEFEIGLADAKNLVELYMASNRFTVERSVINEFLTRCCFQDDMRTVMWSRAAEAEGNMTDRAKFIVAMRAAHKEMLPTDGGRMHQWQHDAISVFRCRSFDAPENGCGEKGNLRRVSAMQNFCNSVYFGAYKRYVRDWLSDFGHSDQDDLILLSNDWSIYLDAKCR